MPDPTTHDYTYCYWGHDYTLKPQDNGQRLVGHCWGNGIHKGDYFVLPNGEHTTRYQVEKVEFQWNTDDMYRIELRFAPREAA